MEDIERKLIGLYQRIELQFFIDDSRYRKIYKTSYRSIFLFLWCLSKNFILTKKSNVHCILIDQTFYTFIDQSHTASIVHIGTFRHVSLTRWLLSLLLLSLFLILSYTRLVSSLYKKLITSFIVQNKSQNFRKNNQYYLRDQSVYHVTLLFFLSCSYLSSWYFYSNPSISQWNYMTRSTINIFRRWELMNWT